MSERDGTILDLAIEPMPEARVVWVDLDATLTDEVFKSVDDIPHVTREGRRLLQEIQNEGLAAGVHTGRVFAADPVIRAAQVAHVGRWIDDEGLRALLPAGVWPWPKPYGKAFVDDRGVTWRGYAGPRIMAEVKRADQRCRRKPRVLLVSPLSDRYNGIGNYGAPALGVWRLRANLVTAGVDCDVWDCNLSPDVPACSDTKALVDAFMERLCAERDPGSYDWVGFSILNDTLPLTLGLAWSVKRKWPALRLVAGNAEATLNYQDVLDKAPFDCVLVGECDHSFPLLAHGEDPRRIEGCIWFSRAVRMTPEQFNAAYEPLDWGAVPWHDYWRRTASLYHGPECPKGKNNADPCDCGTYVPYLDKWLSDGVTDAVLLPRGIDAKAGARKLLSICTVRLVTMDHCFLPCTYCLDGRSLIRTERGLEEIQSIVARGERVRVMQHDGTYGLATEFHRRPYSGPLVRLDVAGHPTPLFLTPDHGVRIDGGRSKPASELRAGDRILAVARGFGEGATSAIEYVTVREVGDARLDNGEVFNLGVEPLHTYVANGVAVDNCSTARIPDFATGGFQRSVFLGMEAVKHLLLKIKREVKGVLTIYDDSDETFLGTKRGLEYAQALLNIKPEMDAGTEGGMSYLVQTRSNEMTRELVEKLASAGVRHLTFGVENASAFVRDSLRKRQDDQQLLDLIDWCVEFKVTPYYLMILFPPETRVEDVEINVRVVAEWIRRGAVVSAEPYLMPYRGTPLLDDPRYTYEHIAFDVPYSGTPGKKLKWPTLVWPRDPAVRGILLAYRATLDDAIRKAKEQGGTEHMYKGWVGRIAISHLARILDLYKRGIVKPWNGDDSGDGQRSAVYQEYSDQESGVLIREMTREKVNGSVQSVGGRFNPSSQLMTAAALATVADLKQGAAKSRAQKDPAAPGEVILG